MKKFKYFLLTKSIGCYINCLVFLNSKKAAAYAYKLFIEPRDGRLDQQNLPEILKIAHNDTFTHLENHFQTYTWAGNSDIILLVHGWESNASRWEQIIPYLQKTGKTIIAIDAPAHGLSSGKEFTVPKYAETIAAFCTKYNPTILIGHSIGGAACVYYQFLHQNNNIQKMVLLGAPSDLKKLIQNYCTMLGLNATIKFHLENTFSEKFNLKVDDFSGQKFGSNITTKALIIHDFNDRIVSFSEGEKIASNWKNATFLQTNNLGHSMHCDTLYQKITSFILEA